MKSPILALVAGLALSLPCAAGLESISNQDAVAGLREALVKGTQYAVDSLGKQDGFFGNGKVKIPLPESAHKIEKVLRQFGMGKQADELILTMNRAAESAMPEAKALLVDSVRKMSVHDANGILTDGQDSATQYFKRTTGDPTRARFPPSAHKAPAQVQRPPKSERHPRQAPGVGLVADECGNPDDQFFLPVFLFCSSGNSGHVGAAAGNQDDDVLHCLRLSP